MALPDFTGQNIQDTYKRVLQVDENGIVYDGTGSLAPVLQVTSSFSISASHEITLEVSSSHAQTADKVGSFTAAAVGQCYDTIANNVAFGVKKELIDFKKLSGVPLKMI